MKQCTGGEDQVRKDINGEGPGQGQVPFLAEVASKQELVDEGNRIRLGTTQNVRRFLFSHRFTL